MITSQTRYFNFQTSNCFRLLLTQNSSIIKARISQSDVKKFSQISGDTNPLHINKEYAQRSIFQQRISHGVLPMGFVQQYFYQQKMKIKNIEMKFVKPIYLDEKIFIDIKVKDDGNNEKQLVLDFVAQIRKAQKRQNERQQIQGQKIEQSLTLVTSISGQVERII